MKKFRKREKRYGFALLFLSSMIYNTDLKRNTGELELDYIKL